MKLVLALLLPFSAVAQDFQPVKQDVRIQSTDIAEASGLAVSSRSKDFLWTLNDSGNPADVFLLGTDGSDGGSIRVSNARNIDWEDIASFTLDRKPYLLIADTGDNNAKRETCTIYIIREPGLPPEGNKLRGTVKTEWKIEFRYEDGPRDCESIAVDARAGKILLVSKRTKPPEAYELPLKPTKSGILTARKLGPVSIASVAGQLSPLFDQPTGMDISPDGTLAAIVTYGGTYLFPRAPKETWAETFAKPPHALGAHGLHQGEAIALSKDAKSLFLTSEGKKAPIRRYDVANPAPPAAN